MGGTQMDQRRLYKAMEMQHQAWLGDIKHKIKTLVIQHL